MESRMVKFYSKESNMVAIHAIPGHFATSHSHINYYIDITSLKTRIREAKEVARVLYHKITCFPAILGLILSRNKSWLLLFISGETT